MSDRPLPENMNDWPDSYLALFGVGQVFGARELKKAYTRLIRFYKPEHYPAEFSRIREAYDQLLPWASSASPLVTPEETLPPPRTEPTLEQGQEGGEHSEFPEPTMIVRPEIADEERSESSESVNVPGEEPLSAGPPPLPQRTGDDFWRYAGQGDYEAARAGLIMETLRRPSEEINYHRLYWIGMVQPALETGASPAHWLCEGLRATGGSQRLLDALGTHLSRQADPELVASLADVLAGLADDHQFAFLQAAAWRRLLSDRRWQTVADQFPGAKSRLANSPAIWLGMVRLIADFAGWEKVNLAGIDLMKTCVRELRELDYLALQRPETFDRQDFLRALVKSASGDDSNSVMAELRRLVRKEWPADIDHVRGELHQLASSISRFPNRWSNRFEEAGPAINATLCQVYHLLLQLHGETGGDSVEPVSSEEGREIVNALRNVAPYARYREKILDYCLDTYSPPESLIEHLAARFAKRQSDEPPLEEQLLSDWSLRLICLAHRFFHS